MNLLSKTLILLIFFNGIEYSWEEGCLLVVKSMSCSMDKFGESSGFDLPDLTGALGRINSRDIEDKNKGCCLRYYSQCSGTFATRKHCPKVDATAQAKEVFESITKDCSPFPTKDLCSKYHKDVKQECKQFSYSECEDYTWSSFKPISVNVVICLSLFVSILIVL